MTGLDPRTPSASLPLKQDLHAALEATAAQAFPTNPVLRELIETRQFTHNGETYRTAHAMDDDICATVGRLAIARGARRCLEVGTLFAFTTLHLAEAMAHTGGRVDTVDIRPPHMKWDKYRSAEPKDIENVHEVAERHVRESGLAEHVRFLAGDSNKVLPHLIQTEDGYDLALIDGAHDFPSVLLDVIAVDNLLAPGGYLMLDDLSRRLATRGGNEGGPNRLLATLFASGRYDILPLSDNVALCRKRAP
jgi:predicted O-methyltransferase YrrM